MRSKRKPLVPENVKRIIVHGTMTRKSQNLTLDDLQQQARSEGFNSLGFHLVITRDGLAHSVVPLDQTGTHTPRFDNNSVGVLMVGGLYSTAPSHRSYTPQQFKCLRNLLDALTFSFPNASPVGAGELFGASNPAFDIKEFYTNDKIIKP